MPKTADTALPDGAKMLRKLIKDVRVAMLTTVSRDGRLRSRPMLTSEFGFLEGLWFVTRSSSLTAADIRDNLRVNVSYADRKGERYVSISGVAQLVHDPAKVKELWSGRHKEWLTLGKKDPDLRLMRVVVEQAEIWDAKTGHMVPVGETSRAASAQPAAAEELVGAGAQG
jgi:general stress protein 26